MTQADLILPVPPRLSLASLLRNMAVPFLLFAVVLATLLTLSFALLLPLFTEVEAGGKQRTAADLQTYHTQVLASIFQEEQERDRAVLPAVDAAYAALRDERQEDSSLAVLRGRILQTASSLVPEAGAVHVRSFTYDRSAHSLTLDGEVRNVGPRSMTVLAQFVDELQRVSGIAAVQPPPFERRDDPVIGPHSPFSIVLTLP